MTTLTITILLVGCGSLLAYVILNRIRKSSTRQRPSINIDFDNAKEREDKNRYFS